MTHWHKSNKKNKKKQQQLSKQSQASSMYLCGAATKNQSQEWQLECEFQLRKLSHTRQCSQKIIK